MKACSFNHEVSLGLAEFGTWQKLAAQRSRTHCRSPPVALSPLLLVLCTSHSTMATTQPALLPPSSPPSAPLLPPMPPKSHTHTTETTRTLTLANAASNSLTLAALFLVLYDGYSGCGCHCRYYHYHKHCCYHDDDDHHHHLLHKSCCVCGRSDPLQYKQPAAPSKQDPTPVDPMARGKQQRRKRLPNWRDTHERV